MKAKERAPKVRVSVCAGALQSIFDECDRYDHDETGGRILGKYTSGRLGALNIEVNGVIEPGPNARRTSSSFFQDGEYQSQVFRKLEATHPSIEHLGNWHTHHVNGYPTLSGGDIETYQRTVNHKNHNLDFFYALLVVARRAGAAGLNRYRVRHYVLFRGDDQVYEVPADQVTVTDTPCIWPESAEPPMRPTTGNGATRARDQDILNEWYPELKPYLSKGTSTLYWKGALRLIDQSVVEIRVLEIADNGGAEYRVLVKGSSEYCRTVVPELGETPFLSAAQAVRAAEQMLNHALYESLRVPTKRRVLWLWKH